MLLILAVLVGISQGLDIHIESNASISEIEPYFCSYAIDMSVLGQTPRWQNFSFSSDKVRTLMKGLQPAILRFGGSPADWTVFTNHLSSERFLNASNATPPFYVFTKKDLDNVVNLTRETGTRFLYDLDLQLRFGTQWDPTNAMQLMEYMKSKGYGENIDFELGNEPGAYHRVGQAQIPPEQVGDDFVLLANLIRSFSNLENSMLVGSDSVGTKPGSTGQKCLHQVVDKAGKYLKAATFHHYYFRGDIASVKDYLDPKHFSNLDDTIQNVKNAIKNTSRPDIPLWIGETADAWHSGTVNVSDRFVSGFLWMDKLGLSARRGVSVVIRQTLYAHNYGLMDDSLNPNPDYWLTWLHKKLVGQKVLEVTMGDNSAPTTRVYAHCATKQEKVPAGSVTVFALNLNDSTNAVLTTSQYSDKMAAAYLMTPPGGDVLSKFVTVNGRVMKLKDDRTLPDVTPAIQRANQITLPPLSFGFFVILDAQAQACMD